MSKFRSATFPGVPGAGRFAVRRRVISKPSVLWQEYFEARPFVVGMFLSEALRFRANRRSFRVRSRVSMVSNNGSGDRAANCIRFVRCLSFYSLLWESWSFLILRLFMFAQKAVGSFRRCWAFFIAVLTLSSRSGNFWRTGIRLYFERTVSWNLARSKLGWVVVWDIDHCHIVGESIDQCGKTMEIVDRQKIVDKQKFV